MTSGVYKRKPFTPEHCAAISKAHTDIPFSPEHCAAISKALTGRTLSPEHCAAMSKGREESGVPRTPEACAAISRGNEESGANDKKRGGFDIVKHHNIYDHNDLSKYITEMTRSQHMSLHQKMKFLGIKIPHINTGHETADELKLMEYIKKVESEPKGL